MNYNILNSILEKFNPNYSYLISIYTYSSDSISKDILCNTLPIVKKYLINCLPIIFNNPSNKIYQHWDIYICDKICSKNFTHIHINDFYTNYKNIINNYNNIDHIISINIYPSHIDDIYYNIYISKIKFLYN